MRFARSPAEADRVSSLGCASAVAMMPPKGKTNRRRVTCSLRSAWERTSGRSAASQTCTGCPASRIGHPRLFVNRHPARPACRRETGSDVSPRICGLSRRLDGSGPGPLYQPRIGRPAFHSIQTFARSSKVKPVKPGSGGPCCRSNAYATRPAGRCIPAPSAPLDGGGLPAPAAPPGTRTGPVRRASDCPPGTAGTDPALPSRKARP